MSDKLNVITGGTGQVGSHIAELLVESGERVRVLVRSSSNTSFLKTLGVEIAEVDFQDPASLRPPIQGADVVYHCAARVSDWGSWPIFQSEVVDVARNVLEACQAEEVGRVLYVSSISVYGHPRVKPGELIAEDAPLGQNMWLWDHYAKAKILAEEAARQYSGALTIVRPSWIYGPRDRVTIPRVVPALRAQRVPIIGSGDNFLNLIYVKDVARGCILAATRPDSAGEVFNLCSLGELTQRQMLDTLTDALSLPRIRRKVPFFLVQRVAFLQELFARMIGKKTPPTITRRAVYLIARPTQFSIDKAKTILGWQPQVHIQEGVKRTLEWYFQETKGEN